MRATRSRARQQQQQEQEQEQQQGDAGASDADATEHSDTDSEQQQGEEDDGEQQQQDEALDDFQHDAELAGSIQGLLQQSEVNPVLLLRPNPDMAEAARRAAKVCCVVRHVVGVRRLCCLLSCGVLVSTCNVLERGLFCLWQQNALSSLLPTCKRVYVGCRHPRPALVTVCMWFFCVCTHTYATHYHHHNAPLLPPQTSLPQALLQYTISSSTAAKAAAAAASGSQGADDGQQQQQQQDSVAALLQQLHTGEGFDAEQVRLIVCCLCHVSRGNNRTVIRWLSHTNHCHSGAPS